MTTKTYPDFDHIKRATKDGATYYDILDLESSASANQISEQYIKLSTAYYPTRNVGTNIKIVYEELCNRMNIAYEVLKNPDLRKAYDDTLRRKGTPSSSKRSQLYSYQKPSSTRITRSIFKYVILGILGMTGIYIVATVLIMIVQKAPSFSFSPNLVPSITMSLPPHTTQATWLPSDLPKDFTDEHGVQMKLIPAGQFEMGSQIGFDHERPVHEVYLDAFYMDIFEVTKSQYDRCVKARVCSDINSMMDWGSTFDDHPVVTVSWEQANDYCEWREAHLPTEAEWEKAARGGLVGKLYPWGDQTPTCIDANFFGCIKRDTKVGSYHANGYGLFDMAGNVWEWVWDVYSANYYENSPSINPRGPDSGEYHIIRGGSFVNDYNFLRVAYRSSSSLTSINYDIGFRCARSP